MSGRVITEAEMREQLRDLRQERYARLDLYPQGDVRIVPRGGR